jgi:hypothetical protein
MNRALSLAVVAAATAFALNACNAGGTSLAPRAMAPSSTLSSIDSKASKGTLLYVSDPGAKTVDVFTYPNGRRIGTLRGFSQPMGECVDLEGNLYVTDEGASRIVEYAHGKSKPINTIDTAPYHPYGCAANLHGGAQTGYFSYINRSDSSHPAGSVTIDGGRRPGTYKMVQFSSIDYICYDQHSTTAILWVDGLNASGMFQMANFHPHRTKFHVVQFPNSLTLPGGVWWDGKALDIADQAGPSGSTVVNQYSVTSRGIGLLGTISLSQQVAQFVTGDGMLAGSVPSQQSVAFWDYPAGGTPKKILSGFTSPFGVAITPVLPKE